MLIVVVTGTSSSQTDQTLTYARVVLFRHFHLGSWLSLPRKTHNLPAYESLLIDVVLYSLCAQCNPFIGLKFCLNKTRTQEKNTFHRTKTLKVKNEHISWHVIKSLH